MRSILSSKVHRYSTALFLVAAKSSFSTSRITITAFAPPASITNNFTPAFNNLSTSTQTRKRTTSSSMSAKKKKEEYPPIPHVPNDEDINLIPTWFNQERTKILTTPDVVEPRDGTCVYYWMQRDMRTQDNWALLYAEYLAKERNVPLKVLYVLPPPVPSSDEGSNSDSDSDGTDSDSNVQVHLPPKVCEMKMTERHGSFLLGGLKIVEEELHAKKVPFQILTPHEHSQVGQSVHDCVTSQDASVVICDMSPLRQYREWMETQASPLMIQSNLPLYQVDAHNVVPVWFASPKRQVGARTLRPKINKLLQDFMTHFPSFEGNCHISEKQQQPLEPISWEECETHLELDESVKTVEWAQPGRKAAMARFEKFTTSPTEGLKNFDTLRNDPNFQNVCSNLSPWVNYGHVSFQRLALEARALKKYPNGTASYIEEGIVRRELSDNFVYYSPDNYDSLETAAVWAQDSLNLHAADEREYIYSLTEFQEATTHDDLWNAAQTQLNIEGKMHGFLRMYWAKKILEWTVSPAQALRFGLYLNDRYALDGNDPNGFTGVGWSVMGIHDMGWKERPIFGKIRFMNYAGCKRKFKVDQFVSRYNDGPPPGDLKSAKAAAKPASKKKAVASATKSKAVAKKKEAPRSNKRKILEHLAKKKSPAKKTKL